jgi:hypothetical protein
MSPVGVVALLLGVVGCSPASVSTAPTQTATSPSSSSSTPFASSTPSADAAGLTVIPIPGYTYTTLPAQMKKMADAMDATGMVTSVVGRGVQDGSGTKVAAIMLMQYNPKLTVLIDKRPTSQILDGAAKGARAFTTDKTTVTAHVLSGSQVRLVQTASLSMLVSYKHGGLLIEVFGPSPASVLSFTGAYLRAGANQ